MKTCTLPLLSAATYLARPRLRRAGLSALAAGAALAILGRRLRLVLGVTLSILLGVTATVISGEYKVGWEILLVDIPLVAVSASVGVLVTRAIFARLATCHSAI